MQVDAKHSVYVSIMPWASWDSLESELIIWMSVLTQEYTFWCLCVFLYTLIEVLTVKSVWP